LAEATAQGLPWLSAVGGSRTVGGYREKRQRRARPWSVAAVSRLPVPRHHPCRSKSSHQPGRIRSRSHIFLVDHTEFGVIDRETV